VPTVHKTPIVPQAFSSIKVSSNPRSVSPAASSGIAASQNIATLAPQDSFRITLKGTQSAINGRPQNQIQFGAGVHVDTPNPSSTKFLGMIRLTENQELQIQSAENKAFYRFEQPGNDISRGSINAKLRHSALNTYQPGYLEHGSGLTLSDDERKQVMDALKDYGEDLASIAIVGRDKRELSHYLEDKAFILVFDKDKDDFEDYIKNGFHDFFGAEATTGTEAQSATVGNTAGQVSAQAEGKPEQENFRWRFFQPRVGVNVRGLNFSDTKVKAQVDLARVNGPANTEVKVVAKVPFTFGGEYNIEGEIQARRILNYKPGEYGAFKDNMYVESNTNYNHEEARLRTTFGVRKQISPDASLGVYGSGTLSTGGEKHDVGLGVNYQLRFD
jgi:hypothetical protein